MTEFPLPPAESLLDHAGFVRYMARATLHGDGDVDDVVQDTWLAALQSAPRNPGALKAWLGGIARRQAASRVRRDASTRRREGAVARPDCAPSAAEMAARVEIGRRLVDAVLELEEPYRRAVLLRYYEDLPPREIAEQLGLPVETVRTRIKRGLRMLRGRLDRVYGDRGGGPVAALLLLAGPPAAHVLPPLLGVIGGVIMANKLLATAAALVVLVGAGIWIGLHRAGSSDLPADPVDTAARPLALEPTDGDADLPTLRGAVPDTPVAVSAEAPASPPPGSVLGVVVEKGTKTPVPWVTVYAISQDSSLSGIYTHCDAHGRFTLAGLPEGEAAVFAQGAGWVSDRLAEVKDHGYDPTVRRIPPGDASSLVLEVVLSAVVEGIVLGADGQPLAGVQVEALQHGMDRRPRRDRDPRVVTTTADGTFLHDALVPEWPGAFQARSADHPPTQTDVITLTPGRTNPRVEIRMTEAARLPVAVVDAETGHGLGEVEIHAAWTDEASGLLMTGTWKTDAEGYVSIRPVPPGRVRLLVRRAGYLEPVDVVWAEATTLDADPATVTIRLSRGVVIRGRVVVPPELGTEGLDVQAEALSPGAPSSAEFPVAEDGTFEITGIAPGTYRVQATLQTARQGWFLGVAEVEAPAGGVVLELQPNDGPFYEEPGENDHRLVPARLVVLMPSGEPARQGWIRYFDGVAASGLDLECDPPRIELDGEGEGLTFEVEDLGDDENGVPLAAGTYGPLKAVDGVVTLRLESGVSLAGRVVSPDGRGVSGVHVEAILTTEETETHGAATDPLCDGHTLEDGSFVLEGLRRDEYYLRLTVPPAYVTPGEMRVRAGGSPDVIRLQKGAVVPLHVLDDKGRPVAGALVAVGPVGEPHPAFGDRVWQGVTDEAGLARIERVVLGQAYEVTISAPESRKEELVYRYDASWLAAPGEIRLESAVLWWWRDGDEEPNHAYADAEGRFRFGPEPFGGVHLRFKGRSTDETVPPWSRDASGTTTTNVGNQSIEIVVH